MAADVNRKFKNKRFNYTILFLPAHSFLLNKSVFVLFGRRSCRYTCKCTCLNDNQNTKGRWDWKILQFYHFARAFNGLFTKARRSIYHQEQVFTDQNYSVHLNCPVILSVDPWPGVASIISNHATLEDAKTECLENPECDGITKIGSDYTVRRGAVLFSYGPSTSYMKSLVHWSDEYTGQSSANTCPCPSSKPEKITVRVCYEHGLGHELVFELLYRTYRLLRWRGFF